MAVLVVDLLEMIGINHQQGQRLVIAAGAFDFLIASLHEKTTIVQPGQFVGGSLFPQLIFQTLALGDVANDAFEGNQPSGGVENRRTTLLDPTNRAIFADTAHGDLIQWTGLPNQQGGKQWVVFRIGALEAQGKAGVKILGRVAGQGSHCRADVDKATFRDQADAEDHVASVFGQQPI